MTRAQQILVAVAAKHKLRVRDITGRDRFDYIVAARREAILEMHAAGMKPGTIARLMGRERTTILEYTNPERAAYKARYHAANWRRWAAAREARV